MKKTTKRPTIAGLKREIQKLKDRLKVAEMVVRSRPATEEEKKVPMEPKTWVGRRTDTRVLYGA